jgi:acyl-CoA synthetase (NDP forming)
MARVTLEGLLNPSSVAILGATDDIRRVGARVMRYMNEAGFQGPVYPINPKRDVVQGKPAFPSISDIPGTADLVIMAIPAPAVAQALHDSAAKGAKAAVVFSSGFAEMGVEGRKMQDELLAAARSAGVRLLGPNCLGSVNVATGAMASFSSNFLNSLPVPGSVAIVSQSGAFGAHLYSLARARGIGLSHWVTTGNEVDITVSECLDFLAGRDEVSTLVAYAEGINDPEGLRRALAKARDMRKPVIFLKVGRTEAGAEAAKSHTASLAVSDAVCDALFKQYGVYRADTTDEMMDVAYASQMGVFPKGRRLAVLTVSGGVGVQMADSAIKHGLEVPALPEATQKTVRELLPFAAARNPVDVTAMAIDNPEHYLTPVYDAVLNEPDTDAVGVFFTPGQGTDAFADLTLGALAKMRAKDPDKAVSINIIMPPEVAKRYEQAGFTVFDTPDRVVASLAALAKIREGFERAKGDAPPALPSGALPVPAEATTEVEAKRILAAAGIPVVREMLAADAAAAVAAAREIAGPVVLKIASPDIQHKTEIGGVLIGIEGDDAVGAGFETLVARAREKAPKARLDGVVVCEMAKGGIETVIGVNMDPTFGPVVMFGLGGIFVEVLKDVTFRLAPFGKDEAMRMIREIKAFHVLTGARGAAKADLDALAETLARVSVFAAANADKLASLDINPYLALETGGVALDALILPKG